MGRLVYEMSCHCCSEDRRAIISAQFSSPSPLHLSDTEWEILTTATWGYSGADLTHLSTAAAFRPIRDLQSARFWKFTDGVCVFVCPQLALDILLQHTVHTTATYHVDYLVY